MNNLQKNHEYLVPVAVSKGGVMLVAALVPNDSQHDGYIVVDKDTRHPVFVYTAYMQYIEGMSDYKWQMLLETKFQRQFWDAQEEEDVMMPDKWNSTFIDRKTPFSEEQLQSIGVSVKEIYGTKIKTQ